MSWKLEIHVIVCIRKHNKGKKGCSYVLLCNDISFFCIDGYIFQESQKHLLFFFCEKEAVAIVQDIIDAEAASRMLIHEAYARGSSDNITCVVVRFKMA